MTSLQFETRFLQLVDAINEESKLPERQWVWVLLGVPGKLCVKLHHGLKRAYLMVFESEERASRSITNGGWVSSTEHVEPMQMHYESVVLHATEQPPDTTYGYPVCGLWIDATGKFIEIEGNPDPKDKGFI